MRCKGVRPFLTQGRERVSIVTEAIMTSTIETKTQVDHVLSATAMLYLARAASRRRRPTLPIALASSLPPPLSLI